jgi:type 1 glutamine amidotransferase
MRLASLLAAASLAAAASLPHVEQVARGAWAVGLAAKYGSANCGFVVLDNETLLIDLPHGIAIPEYLAEVNRIAGKPAKSVLLTALQEAPGLSRIDKHPAVQVIPYDSGRRAVWLPVHGVLFAGAAVVNGPRADVTKHDTAAWLQTLDSLASRKPTVVVPGFGSWGGPGLIARQRRFIAEMRRQVGYAIAMGRPISALQNEFLLPASYYTWMPYDLPRPEDLNHVHAELTVPRAPFGKLATDRPNALVLIGDRFHEPEHLEAGLRPVLESAGVMPHFTVDVRALSAANLAKVDLLVVLRDGMNWPDGPDRPYQIWMSPEQEKAVVDFVEGGKAFLNLHNSMGLYPKDGPYLNLVGGNYIGHGPLERFKVEVADKNHPITRGLADWWAADEQHTPPYDEKKVRLLLRNRSDEGKVAAAGWAWEPGRGRLAHLASGHTRDALEHPMYRRALGNAVRWLLRRESAQ